jgi:hypothetical protein
LLVQNYMASFLSQSPSDLHKTKHNEKLPQLCSTQ